MVKKEDTHVSPYLYTYITLFYTRKKNCQKWKRKEATTENSIYFGLKRCSFSKMSTLVVSSYKTPTTHCCTTSWQMREKEIKTTSNPKFLCLLLLPPHHVQGHTHKNFLQHTRKKNSSLACIPSFSFFGYFSFPSISFSFLSPSLAPPLPRRYDEQGFSFSQATISHQPMRKMPST